MFQCHCISSSEERRLAGLDAACAPVDAEQERQVDAPVVVALLKVAAVRLVQEVAVEPVHARAEYTFVEARRGLGRSCADAHHHPVALVRHLAVVVQIAVRLQPHAELWRVAHLAVEVIVRVVVSGRRLLVYRQRRCGWRLRTCTRSDNSQRGWALTDDQPAALLVEVGLVRREPDVQVDRCRVGVDADAWLHRIVSLRSLF